MRQFLLSIGMVIFWGSIFVVPGFAGSASAEGRQGDYYFGVNTGVVWRADNDDSRTGIGEAVFEEPCCRVWHADLKLGHEDPARWLTRLETELGFQSVDVNRYTLTGGGSNDGLGDWESTALAINGYRDFYPGSVLEPYLGVGGGWTLVNVDTNGSGGPIRADNDTDNTWVAQVMAGVRSRLTSATRVVLQYRYRATGDLDYSDLNGVTFEVEGLRDQQVEAGLQVSF